MSITDPIIRPNLFPQGLATRVRGAVAVCVTIIMLLTASLSTAALADASRTRPTTPAAASEVRILEPPVSDRSGAFLRIEIPEQVELQQPITLKLSVVGATDLAGYEAQLLFDTAAAEFSVLEQRDKDLRRVFGRDVAPLGAVEMGNGIAFGVYSCPVANCLVRKGVRQAQGARGTVTLATISLIPTRAGTLQIRLADAKFVNAAGAPVSVALPDPLLSVQVGPTATPALPAPASSWSLSAMAALPVRPADITGDRSVTNADASALALLWQIAREDGSPCGPLDDPLSDINGDGCLDVGDVQSVTAKFTLTAGATPGANVGEFVLASFSQPSSPAPSGAAAPGDIVVNSAGDPGSGGCDATECTLREAITAANASAGADAINFAIPGGGVHTIQLSSRLPIIGDESGPVTIDGYTQPGSAVNTDAAVSNAAIGVQVRGRVDVGSLFEAFQITSSGNTIRGLAIFNARRAIVLYGAGARGNRILGNFLGTDADGTFMQATSVATQGVNITNRASYTQIGTNSLADRNVISGNGRIGLLMAAEGTDHNTIHNNLIGLSPSGAAMRNGYHGIDINGHSSYNRIGGIAAGERNVISANTCAGIEISHGTLTVQNQVVGNYIGTDVNASSGTVRSGNGCSGVQLEDGVTSTTIANNVIGLNGRVQTGRAGISLSGFYTAGNRVSENHIGVSPSGVAIPNRDAGVLLATTPVRSTIGPRNVIANHTYGVRLRGDNGTDFHRITENSIYGNSGLGIDIFPDGVTPNDPGDTDTGPNEALNFPVLTGASATAVSGTVCAGCRVEVFIADSGAGQHGEGKTFVGATTAASNGRFSAGVTGITTGQWVTATAIDSAGNTSEFSLNQQVPYQSPGTPGPTPQPTPTPCSQVCAEDHFTRVVNDGWGTADIGGAWAPEGNSACDSFHPTGACDIDVNGSEGLVNTPVIGSARGAYLTDVSVRDVDLRFRVRTNKTAAGANQAAQFAARRVSGGSEYRGKLQFTPTGAVNIQVVRVSGGVETTLGLKKVPGLTHQAGSWICVLARLTGENPTTIQMKAWIDPNCQNEPGWHITLTDSTAALQAAGGVGLRALVANGTTNAPVLFSFDDFVAEPPAATPPPPNATFAWSQQPGTLTVDFTDTSTGSPTSWSWDFGDLEASTEQSPSHTYSTSGSYQVTLTATNAGGSDTDIETVTVDAPVATEIASDRFGRVESDTWGSADLGGAYSHSGAASYTATDFDVNQLEGTMNAPVKNATRTAVLNSVSAQDVDISFRVKSNKAAAGGHQFVHGIVRQVASNTYYRVKIRLGTDGKVYVRASTVVNGTETGLGTEVAASGLTHTADSFIWLRSQVTGSPTATIQIRAWADGQTEPTTWAYTVQDSQAQLQTAGGVGLQAYLGSQATNAPVLFSFDDFTVTDLAP